MDPRKFAAEKKAKALADLKEAEEMEADALKLEELAAKRGWRIQIEASSTEASARGVIATVNITSQQQPTQKRKPPTKQVDPNSTTSRAKSVSRKVIKDLGRPVPLRELNNLLIALGVQIGGKNPTQALSANLGRAPEFVSTKDGWWLAELGPPPANKPSGVVGQATLAGLN